MTTRGRFLVNLAQKSDQKPASAINNNTDMKYGNEAELRAINETRNFFEMGPYLTPAINPVSVTCQNEFENQYPDPNDAPVLTPLAPVDPNIYPSDFTFRPYSVSQMSLDNFSDSFSLRNLEPSFFEWPENASTAPRGLENIYPVSIRSTNPHLSPIPALMPPQNEPQFIIPDSSPASSPLDPEFEALMNPDNPLKLCIRKVPKQTCPPENDSKICSYNDLDCEAEYDPQICSDEKRSFELSSQNPASVRSEETNVASVASCSNGSEIPTPKRTRKKNSNPNRWLVKKAKIRRNLGKSYVSVSKTKRNIECRKLRPPCGLKCRHRCSEKFSKEARKEIFSQYWALGDISKQRCFVAANVQSIKPSGSNLNRARQLNQAYYFDLGDDRIRVCKLFFCATLDINSRVIRTVLAKKSNPVLLNTDFRGKHNNHPRVSDEMKQGVRDHIDSIPRIESHYLRAQTTREFIDGGRSLTDIYRDYTSNCEANNRPFVNIQLFSKIFNEEYNLGFFIPKKDQCETCVAFENAEGDEKEALKEKYDTHQEEKVLSRSEKDQDKAKICQNYLVAVYDLQAVLPVPRGNVSVFYYKSKLNSYNFTISQLESDETHCYLWHEGEGNRGAEEIASCVFKFIEATMKKREESGISEDIDIVFYSDNCCGQQKNKFMVALYIYAVKKFEKINSISHKYLITGHTQNEGDSVHSVIEKKVNRSLKSGPIYVPDQYAELIRGARKTGNPYTVHQLTHPEFLAIKKLTVDLGLKFDRIKISSVKAWKIEKSHPEIFQFKNSFSEMNYEQVDLAKREKVTRQSKKLKVPVLPDLDQLYSRPIAIKERKKEDLLSLVASHHIPKIHESFFKNLL